MKRILLLTTLCLALAACQQDDDCRRSSVDQAETLVSVRFTSRSGGFSSRSFSSRSFTSRSFSAPKTFSTPSYRAPSRSTTVINNYGGASSNSFLPWLFLFSQQGSKGDC